MIFLEWVFFREEGLAGNGCRNTLKSQLFVLFGSLGKRRQVGLQSAKETLHRLN